MNYCSHPYKEVKTNMEVDHVLLLNLNQNINRFLSTTFTQNKYYMKYKHTFKYHFLKFYV